jgi:hypothetical protein
MAIPLFFMSAYIYCCLVKNRKCSRPIRNKPSICFSGCGLRYHFYGGVAEYLLDNFETDNIDILCVSGGIYAATILALQCKMTVWNDREWHKCYEYFTKRSLYVFLDTLDFQRNLWRNYLPDNAYCICSDRLFISVSRFGVYGFYEDIICKYNSNEELIDAICGTMHFIGLFRKLPIVCGKFAFDGCFTNLLPRTKSQFSTLVVKLFGRGSIDYGNRLSIKKLLAIVEPNKCNPLIHEGYQIASKQHHTFIEHGFKPLT